MAADKTRHQERFERLAQKHKLPDSDALERLAANMKERIYASITLLAVIAAQLQAAHEHTARGVLVSIIGTVIALWLATMIAANIAHKAVHGTAMPERDYRKEAFAASGIFVPAIVPAIFVTASWLNFIELKTALIAGIVALLVALVALSYVGTRRVYENKLQVVIVGVLELLLGAGVVLLKLTLGE